MVGGDAFTSDMQLKASMELKEHNGRKNLIAAKHLSDKTRKLSSAYGQCVDCRPRKKKQVHVAVV
jgi:hypothetical protein